MNPSPQPNVDPQEVAKFADMADLWWRPEGEFKALHEINPVRLAYVAGRAAGLARRRVIDVGCGSGILSIGAIKMGASKALAVDIDAASVRATDENAAANEVGDQIFSAAGSVEEILQGQYFTRQAPLVLANILAPVLVRLFNEDLAKLISPGGVILLSGILIEQATEVEVEAGSHGLKLLERMTIGDWIALAFQKPARSTDN